MTLYLWYHNAACSQEIIPVSMAFEDVRRSPREMDGIDGGAKSRRILMSSISFRKASTSASSFLIRKTVSSRTASWYLQAELFRSHLWHGCFPSHRTLDVRQLTQALMARRLRGRSDEVVRSIGNFARRSHGVPQLHYDLELADPALGRFAEKGRGVCGGCPCGDTRRGKTGSDHRMTRQKVLEALIRLAHLRFCLRLDMEHCCRQRSA